MSKLYTKGGDQGQTHLFSGNRVLKSHPRLQAYGTLDELNSHCGLLLSLIPEKTNNIQPDMDLILKIQNELFNIGSHLACDKEESIKKLPSLHSHMTNLLEKRMDEHSLELPPIKQFILPGGSTVSSQSHICRCVCRRSERFLVELSQVNKINPLIISFINRLSDYFFSLARWLNFQLQTQDQFWFTQINETHQD